MNEIIPTFIINRNLVTWPRMMVDWMKKIPILKPVIYDNASTYPPLLEWYATNPCDIIRMPVNTWHNGIFASGIIQDLKSKYYIITDPDFDLSAIPLDVIGVLKYGLEKYPEYGKCGLSIRTDDIPDEFSGKQNIINWESKYWLDPLDDLFYKAHIDTTFALYDASRLRHYTYDAIRTGPPYIARHIPWYLTKNNMSEEFVYYCDHNEGPATICWYCNPMIEDYKSKH